MNKKVLEAWKSIQSAYSTAKTETEFEAARKLQHEFQDNMTPEELKEFNDLLIADTHDLLAEGDDMISDSIREKMGELPEMISMAYIAKNYFGKSNSWLSQRLNGSKVNGKRARFNAKEVQQLQDALHDIGNRLLSVAF